MAYIQDISVLMRELLKVPKDYTPTAMEISKYIKSRYSNDKDIGNRPMGARGFSSGPQFITTKRSNAPPLTINSPPPPPKPRRMVAKQRPVGRSLSSSSIRPIGTRNPVKKNNDVVLKKGDVKTAKPFTQDRTFHQRRPAEPKASRKPQTAPTQVADPRAPRGDNRSLWSWQSAKNHVRRAVSEIASIPATKTKLSALADQHRMDPNLEGALERQRKEMLKHMLEPGVDRVEPVRNREIIQKLLEDNKLEAQRREIAKLTELARVKVLEAKRLTYAKNARKREMEYGW